MEEDLHVYVVDVPKPRVFVKKSDDLLKMMSARRISQKKYIRKRTPLDGSSAKYVLLGEKPLKAKLGTLDAVLLSYRQYAEQQQKLRQQRRAAISIFNKYKIISADLHNRLYVKDPPNDIFTIRDVDNAYFKFIDGRPIQQRTPLFKSLKHMFHLRLMIQQEIGYRKDTIMNIDVNFMEEQKVYDLAVQRLNIQVKLLDQFISDNYNSSILYLEKWEKLKIDVNNKKAELEYYGAKVFTLSSKLVGLNFRNGVLQKYGRFLFYLSPPKWRMHHREFAKSIELETLGFDLGTGASEVDSFDVMFENMQKEIAEHVKSVLYFSHPSDIMEVFETVQEQQLNNFAHVTNMTPIAKMINKGIKAVKDVIIQETTGISSTVEWFQSLIDFYTERGNNLEDKFFRVLHGMFYESVGTFEVLKFYLHLEFCYQKIFPEKLINVDICTMAKSLESTYLEYAQNLDLLTNNSVRAAVKKFIEIEKNKNKKMIEAARELRYFDRLKKDLLRSFEPPRYQSKPALKTVTKIKKKIYSLPATAVKKAVDPIISEGEKEYLTIFTEWTEDQNPYDYLHKTDTEEKSN